MNEISVLAIAKIDMRLWKDAKLKASQLEAEIHACSATTAEKSNMMHSLSKLWMFANDAVWIQSQTQSLDIPAPRI